MNKLSKNQAFEFLWKAKTEYGFISFKQFWKFSKV